MFSIAIIAGKKSVVNIECKILQNCFGQPLFLICKLFFKTIFLATIKKYFNFQKGKLLFCGLYAPFHELSTTYLVKMFFYSCVAGTVLVVELFVESVVSILFV